MNPVFVFLVLLGAFLVWLTFSFLYQPIGRFFGRLIKDAKEAMEDEPIKDNNKENKEDI